MHDDRTHTLSWSTVAAIMIAYLLFILLIVVVY